VKRYAIHGYRYMYVLHTRGTWDLESQGDEQGMCAIRRGDLEIQTINSRYTHKKITLGSKRLAKFARNINQPIDSLTFITKFIYRTQNNHGLQGH